MTMSRITDEGSLFSKYDIWFAIVMGVVVCVLKCQYVPCADDFRYAFNVSSCAPIASFNDVIQSNVYDYFHQNGRFLIHVFVSLICGFDFIIPFALVSGIMYALLLLGCVAVVRVIFPFHTESLSSVRNIQTTWVSLLLLLLIPEWGLVIGGNVAFTVNYLWASVAYVWFAFYYYRIRQKQRYSGLAFACIMLLSFISGALQESFAIGLMAALLIMTLIRFRSMGKKEWLIVVAFALGFIVVMGSLGNWSRMNGLQSSVPLESGLLALLCPRWSVVMSYIRTPAVLMLFAFLLVGIASKHVRRILRKTYLLWFSAISMVLFACFIAYTGSQQKLIVALFGAVIFLAHPRLLILFNKWYVTIQSMLIVLIFLSMVPSIYYRSRMVKANDCLKLSMLS